MLKEDILGFTGSVLCLDELILKFGDSSFASLHRQLRDDRGNNVRDNIDKNILFMGRQAFDITK